MRGYQLVLVVGSFTDMDSSRFHSGYLDYPCNLGNNLCHKIVGQYEGYNLLSWTYSGLYHKLCGGYEFVRLTGFGIGHFHFLTVYVH